MWGIQDLKFPITKVQVHDALETYSSNPQKSNGFVAQFSDGESAFIYDSIIVVQSNRVQIPFWRNESTYTTNLSDNSPNTTKI